MAKKRERDALAEWVLGRKKKAAQPEEKKAEKKAEKKKKAKGNPERVALIRRCHARRLREKRQISEEMAADV